MEKIIQIDLYDAETLYERYNRNMVSRKLIDYIIEQAMFISVYDTVKVLINNECKIDKNYIEMIKEGLRIEYKKKLRNRYYNNIKQLVLLLIGTLFLFMTVIIKDNFVFREVVLIIGWVPIWAAIEIELFTDAVERRKRKIIKKLLESDFEIL
jgi:hypothetical protein